MAKPVLLTLDDDPEVLRAIERDLRRRYGARYRVLRASTGASALDALRQLKLRNEAVALMLVDQRMPQMQGVDFLEQAIKLFPDAKRLLLTAYADTEAAIKAINEVQIDYYLRKPWDPPETQLYPVLDDLLDKWDAGYRPPFEGVRVVGHRWLPEGYQIKNLLARNHVTYQWLDVEVEAEARQLAEIVGVGRKDLPLVILPDGSQLVRPSVDELAERVGLQTRATSRSSRSQSSTRAPASKIPFAAPPYSASSARSPIPVGWKALSSATNGDSFWPARISCAKGDALAAGAWIAIRSCSRRAFRVSLSLVTSGMAR